jgi:hypothetical protein
VNVPGTLASSTGERLIPAWGDGTATADLRQRRLARQRAPLDEAPPAAATRAVDLAGLLAAGAALAGELLRLA